MCESKESFKRMHPEMPHTLFTLELIREFIRKHYNNEVLSAFDNLKPFAYKSDLARQCILYQLGGVYADISLYFMKPWSSPYLTEKVSPLLRMPSNVLRLGVFRDFCVSSPWDTVVGLYCAPPRHKAMEAAINMICANVKERYYGNSSLCPTGPALFGKAIASTCRAEDLIVGDSRWYSPELPLRPNSIVRERSHCFIYDNELVAIRRKRGAGSLSEIGIHGGNEYYKMWAKEDVYL